MRRLKTINMKYDVFISYRRKVGTHQARALKSDLELNGYRNRVFMDTDKLKGGDFTKKLRDTICESCNIIIIISQGCFDEKKEGTDYFIYEISQALKQEKNLIPIYYDGVKYEDIKEHLHEIEDFPKQNAITYDNNNPNGSISQIISFLKKEKEILEEGYESLSKKRAKFRKKLLLLNEESKDLNCPICKNNYSAAMSYCQTCGYKFFDDLEQSVAEEDELIQEKERKKKHLEVWKGYCERGKQQGNDEQFKKLQSNISDLNDKLKESEKQRKELEVLKDKVEKLESQVESKKKELAYRDLQLKESEKQRRNLELQLSHLTDNPSHQGKDSILEIKLDDNVKFKMIHVEGGTFMMGANEENSEASDDERPAHKVTLSSYSIGETAVTQALWEAVMGNNPSHFKGADRPVERVSWKDCQEFIRKLNEKTNRKFRLPTEAEWEFAARGGNKSKGFKYAGSNNIVSVAWYDGNSGNETHPVAQKQPNELGLFDMSGNVYEWCQDWYGEYSNNSQTNPTGPEGGNYRMRRGGSWYNRAGFCRTSFRNYSTPSYRDDFLGLRLAL